MRFMKVELISGVLQLSSGRRADAARGSLRALEGALLLSVAVLWGCAGREHPAQEVLGSGPLPYHVGIFVDTESLELPSLAWSDAPAGEEPNADVAEESSPSQPAGAERSLPQPPADHRIRCLLSLEELTRRMAGPLRADFSKLTILPAGTREQTLLAARGAASREGGLDLLLAVGFETKDEYRDYRRPGGWVVLEIVCWLFGGVPAWFVPTVEYATDSRLSLEGVDLGGKRVRDWWGRAAGDGVADLFDWKENLEAPAQNVSLWDRSHPFDRPLDYVSTFLVPPMVLVPGDPMRLSRELTGDIADELAEKLREAVRKRIVEQNAQAPLSLVFSSPRAGVILDSLTLKLGISVHGQEKIKVFDVNRLASGSKTFRWVASAEDVTRLGQALESRRDPADYISYEVPAAIPLEPGENTIKVRALASSGELVTRTAVYYGR